MPSYVNSAPGVYIEEIPSVGPIQGVGTSTAAFIGLVAGFPPPANTEEPEGPDGPGETPEPVRPDPPKTPTLVTNWTQYKDLFGEYAPLDLTPTGAAGQNRLLPYAVRGFFDNGGTRAYIVNEADIGNALDQLTRFDINLLVVPDAMTKADQERILTHCRTKQQSCFAILNAADAVKQPDLAKEAGELRGLNRGYGAVYYPWIRVRAPSVVKLPPNTITIAVPPSGHIAGIYARSDAQRGVHKAPANEVIQGALELTARLNDTEHGTLNAANVNVLRSFPNSPPMVWGARTLSQNPAYHYVGVERLLIYIEQSLQSGLRWAVFEPNDFSLWKKLERTVTEFLTRVWRSGALFGQSAEQAFFVKVDEELNPADSRALGMVIVEVGVAPVRPAEFVIIRLALREGGADE